MIARKSDEGDGTRSGKWLGAELITDFKARYHSDFFKDIDSFISLTICSRYFYRVVSIRLLMVY